MANPTPPRPDRGPDRHADVVAYKEIIMRADPEWGTFRVAWKLVYMSRLLASASKRGVAWGVVLSAADWKVDD